MPWNSIIFRICASPTFFHQVCSFFKRRRQSYSTSGACKKNVQKNSILCNKINETVLYRLVTVCTRPGGLPIFQLNIQYERDVACTFFSPMVSHKYLHFVCVPLSHVSDPYAYPGINGVCNDRNFNLLFGIVFFFIINSSHDVQEFLRIIILRNKAI